MKNHYLKAVTELISRGDNPTAVLTGLKIVLEKRGHSKLYANILQATVRQLTSKQSADMTVITVASPEDYKLYETEILAALEKLQADIDNAKLISNHHIVGGFRISTKTNTIDQTHRTKLLKLYRTVTS